MHLMVRLDLRAADVELFSNGKRVSFVSSTGVAYLSFMGDDDVVVVVDRNTFERVLIDAWNAVGREQALVLSHAQRLALLS